jgi:hypothetical protein
MRLTLAERDDQGAPLRPRPSLGVRRLGEDEDSSSKERTLAEGGDRWWNAAGVRCHGEALGFHPSSIAR